MHSFASRALAAGIALALSGIAQAEIVVSQIHTGAGSLANSPYRNNYIELHNTGDASVSLGGWSLQFNPSTTANNWQRSALSGSIPAGGYFLIATGSPVGGLAPLPTPDLQLGFNLQPSNGRIAVMSENRTLSGQCPTGTRDRVIWGNAARCNAAAPLASPLRNEALLRGKDGCDDSGIDSADFAVGAPAPRNSRSPAKVCAGQLPITLSVADIALSEGDSGRTPFAFTLKLDRPAPAGGVAWRASTNPGSANAGEDFEPTAPNNGAITGTIAEGATTASVVVKVVGDRLVEADETFELHVQALTPGVITDADGVLKAKATILNDDFAFVPIGAVQGIGAQSPLLGQPVSVQGTVTAVAADGLFVQNSATEADGSPDTSDALFVLTGQAGDPGLVGQRVSVSGTVFEHAPDPATPAATLTAIGGSPRIDTLGAGVLPAMQPLLYPVSDAARQLRRLESMRVRLTDELRVVGPTGGRIVAGQDTTISDGTFYAMFVSPDPSQQARPQREPGLRVRPQNPLDSANAPLLPVWDGNPEVIAIDSSASGSGPLQVASEARLRDAGGVLSLRNGRSAVLMSSDGKPFVIAPGMAPRSADDDRDGATAPTTLPLPPLPADRAISVAYYDLERLFDVQDDPRYADEVPTAAAFERNLRKVALGILDSLGAPDVVALGGVEGNALQALSMRIDALAAESRKPLPNYQYSLFEGNDPRGLKTAFLYKTAAAQGGGFQRVGNAYFQPIGANATWEGPGPLYRYPPLAMDATVHLADGSTAPLNLVLVGMDGRADSETGSAGLNAEGVRMRRQRQAEFLAGYLNQRQNQAVDGVKPPLLVLGDFDNFAFSDGYVDTVDAIAGTPGDDMATSVPDGQDWVQPDLIQADSLIEAQRRYSSVEQGSTQNTRHALLSEEFVLGSEQLRVQRARINADFPAFLHDDASTPARAASSDPLRISWLPRVRADLTVGIEPDGAAAVPLGQRLRYRASLRNHGPGIAGAVGVAFASIVPDGDLHVVPPSPQWTCEAPAVSGNATTVTCSAAQLPAGTSEPFQVDAATLPAMVGASVPLAVSATAQSYDPTPDDSRAVVSVQVTPPVDPGTAPTP